MRFELANSFDDNLALFRAEAEALDPDCAKIFFDNMHILCREDDPARDRGAITEFHKVVAAALESLPDTTPEGAA
jgi:hypothetical protein